MSHITTTVFIENCSLKFDCNLTILNMLYSFSVIQFFVAEMLATSRHHVQTMCRVRVPRL